MPKTRIVHSTSGVELARNLSEEGFRIFTMDQAEKVAKKIGISRNYLKQALHHLKNTGWIIHLRKGLYALSSTIPNGSPIHEFEIAMTLVEPGAISHWSALHYHGLTEQIPQQVFILTTDICPLNTTILGIKYHCMQVKPERYFGTQKIWVGDARVVITDPERTLLDGLMKPQYCGDFAEVMHAFEVYLPKLNLDRIIEYALKLDTVVAKRLGWILEHQGINLSQLDKLATLPIQGYRPLDPTRPKKGKCNNYWSIQENLSGKIIK